MPREIDTTNRPHDELIARRDGALAGRDALREQLEMKQREYELWYEAVELAEAAMARSVQIDVERGRPA